MMCASTLAEWLLASSTRQLSASWRVCETAAERMHTTSACMSTPSSAASLDFSFFSFFACPPLPLPPAPSPLDACSSVRMAASKLCLREPEVVSKQSRQCLFKAIREACSKDSSRGSTRMAAGKLCVRDQSRTCLFMDAYTYYIYLRERLVVWLGCE